MNADGIRLRVHGLRATLHGPRADGTSFPCVVRDRSERLDPATRVLVAPLATGAGALVADAAGHVRLGTLIGSAWSFVPTDAT